MPADMHCHSVVSDGSAQIAQIIRIAEGLGLDAISITDHDDFGAYGYLEKADEKFSIKIIKGEEISARDNKTGRKVHMLCYLPKNEQPIEELTALTRESRKNELRRAVEILGKDYPITFDMIEERREKYGGYFKQHIMQLLMEMGYCDRIFGDLYHKLFNPENGIAQTHVKLPDVYDVLAAIRKARGVAVMAHPAVYNSFELLETLCKEKLLDGIEADHPKQSPQTRDYLRSLALQYDLLQTGGTDFHGYNTSNPNPLGTCTTGDDQLRRLFEISQTK